MSVLEKYDDFLFNSIFEGIKVSELPFVLSERLRKLLNNIEHPIATELLALDTERKKEKVTFIDIDTKENSPNDIDDVIYKRFTFVNSGKAYDNIIKHYEEKPHLNLDYDKVVSTLQTQTPRDSDMYIDYWKKSRTPIKIGSFITKLFDNKYVNAGDIGNDVTSFVNMIYGYRMKEQEGDFELVSGDDIIYWYNEDQYISGGTLSGSCMRHDRCGEYINFYAKNKDVKLLILHDLGDRTKIIGRAIVWKLKSPDRYFMDRVYYISDNIVELFKNYAEKNNWLCKYNQNMTENEKILDMGDGGNNLGYITLVSDNTIAENDTYPYADTMKYYSPYLSIISNSSTYIEGLTDDEYYRLDGIEGDDYERFNQEEEEGIYVEYYGDYFDEDDIVWCEYGNEYRKWDDAIELSEGTSEYATQSYIDRYMVWSEYHDQYIKGDESSWVEYNNDYILDDDIVEVYLDADFATLDEAISKDDTEERGEYDSDSLEYVVDNKKYFFDNDKCGEFFVNAIKNDTQYRILKHVVWDKDELFVDGNKVYFFDDEKAKDNKTGQLRLFDSKIYNKLK